MTPITTTEPSGTTLNTKSMISDLKRGRIKVVAMIAAAAILVTGAVLYFV
jgi:hypothetical protein